MFDISSDAQVACIYHNDMADLSEYAVINAHPFQVNVGEMLPTSQKNRHCLNHNVIDAVALTLPEIKHKPSTVIITEVVVVQTRLCLADTNQHMTLQIHSSDDDKTPPQKRLRPA